MAEPEQGEDEAPGGLPRRDEPAPAPWYRPDGYGNKVTRDYRPATPEDHAARLAAEESARRKRVWQAIGWGVAIFIIGGWWLSFNVEQSRTTGAGRAWLAPEFLFLVFLTIGCLAYVVFWWRSGWR